MPAHDALCMLNTFQKHFDDKQFESHRLDGWRKLRPDAVPTIFPHLAPARFRKPPAKRSPQVSPSKVACMKRLRIEHPYSTTSFKSTTSSVIESSVTQQVAGEHCFLTER